MKNSKYLQPELLSKLQNLSIKAKYVVEGFMIGLHKSPYHGFSVEFSEHRPYGFGDEVRHIDWKIWSKTNKYYIKQFEEETNLKAHIILDQSRSMGYFGSFKAAKKATLALSALIRGMFPRDLIHVIGFSDYAIEINESYIPLLSWNYSTSGTNMVWKVRFLNQTGVKYANLHAVSLGWS